MIRAPLAAGSRDPWDDLALNFRATLARAYVRVVGSVREPAWIIGDAVLPVIGMCGFVMFYRALGAPRSFEALAIFGGILSTYWINVLWGMGAQLYWEKQQGQLQLYFAAPCSRMAILTGMALGGVIMSTLRATFGVAIGIFVFHVQVAHFQIGTLALVFVATMGALYAMGMTFASVFLLFGREAWHVCNALQEPVYFLSGVYFPIRALGAFGMICAGLIPLAFGVDAMRQVLIGAGAHALLPVAVETTALFAFAVVFLFFARVALAHLEALSKREGRLTQRWQ